MAMIFLSNALKECELEFEELHGCPVVKRGSWHGNPFYALRREDVLRIVEAKKEKKNKINTARAAVAERRGGVPVPIPDPIQCGEVKSLLG